MKVLFIGGTGNISSAVSRLALARGVELCHVNRGRSGSLPGVRTLVADVHAPGALERALGGERFDVVVDWIAFTPEHVQRDLELFAGRVAQYVFISSASVYQKPLQNPVVTEETPLANPYWQYARDKIACEALVRRAHEEGRIAATIVRPGLTYETVIPVPLAGWLEYTIVARMKRGRRIVVHGDGSSLWTVTHAEDFAPGFLGLLGRERALGEAFHVTSDELLTWNQIYEALAAAAGCEPRIVHVPSDLIAELSPDRGGSLLGDKSVSIIFDNSKLRSLVPEFRPAIRFADGIRRTLAWFEADPARMLVNPESDALIDRILERYALAFPAARD